MDTYLIDQKIIALLLNKPEDDPQVGKFMEMYAERIAQLTEKLIREVGVSEGMSRDDVENELQLLSSQNFADSKLLADDNFIDALSLKKNEYHKLIYDKYRPIITEDQKQKLNEYIARVQEFHNDVVEEQRKQVENALDQIEAEAIITGQISTESLDGEIATSSSSPQPTNSDQMSQNQLPNI